eukprot:6238416-Amphidinium_carterae.1
MPECVPMSPEYKERTMHTIPPNRRIQEHTHQEHVMPLAPGSLVGAGERKVKRMPCESETTKWVMLFNMVAELAMWQAALAI